MKIKRLLSLALCMIMLVSTVALTGCEKKEEEEEEKTSTQSVTLNMFIVTEDETTDEQAKAVQLAINEITLKRFKTKLKINFIKEADYWTEIENTILAIEEAALVKEAEGEKTADGEEVAEDRENADENAEDLAEVEETAEGEAVEEEEVTLDDELDQLHKDGDIFLEEPQLDIIVFNTYERYRAYANNGKLAAMDEYLFLDSKILKSYIYPTFLEAAKLGGSITYGIPVNGPIGSYEYFVFDAELANKYGFNVNSVKSFADLEGYLATIKANEPDVVPLNKATTPLDFEFYSGNGSPFGIFMSDTATEWPDKILPTYEQEAVVEHYRTINKFRQAGYLADKDTPEDARYAVQILEGTVESPEKWEELDGRDYECVVYREPKLTNANALSGVFAISSLSKNKARAMEIIKEFNINSELANLLQWGVENVHYYMNDKDDGMGTITLINDSGYKMNKNYTGNKYIKYRLVGEPWEFEAQKEQNLISRVGGLAGFNPVLDESAEEVFQNAHTIAAKYYPDLIGGYGNFDEIMANLIEELGDVYPDGSFEKFISHKIGGDYYNFAEAMNIAYPNGGNAVEEAEDAESADAQPEAPADTEPEKEEEETKPTFEVITLDDNYNEVIVEDVSESDAE